MMPCPPSFPRAARVSLLLAVLAVLPGGLRAEPAPDSAAVETRPAARAARARSPWSGSLELGRLHDDNVLQLTRTNLTSFTNNPGPPRFLISDVGDWATNLDATLRWRGRPVRRRETRAAAGFQARRFDRDHVADWQDYALSLDQEITASRRHLLTATGWVDHIPDYYLGEITDLDESVAAGRRVRNSLTYSQTRYGARIAQEIWSGRIGFEAGIERVHRGYNRHFAERVNDNDQFRLAAEARPFRRWDASARVTWLKGDMNARGELPDSLGVPDQDISYDHDGVGASLTLPWNVRGWRGRLDGSYQPETRRYTTDNKFDVNRFRRTNRRREVRVRFTERLVGPFDVQVSWSRLSSRGSFAVASGVDPASTRFDQEQFGIALRGRWEFAGR